jgi:hypothetical protein
MSTNDIFDELSQFCREDVCADFYAMAQETFWEDIINLTGIEDFGILRKTLPISTRYLAEVNLTTFFASNDYQQYPDPRDPRWNAVERFISDKGKGLASEDEHFLTALRRSHMSLYRIIELEPEGNVKLWDMIDGMNVIAHADQETYLRLSAKEIWGFRLIKTRDWPKIIGGALPQKESTAKVLATSLKKTHARLMRHAKQPDVREEFGRVSEEEIGHLARVMWAPEISTAYIKEELARIDRTSDISRAIG